jgi:hypothetical protein
VETPVVVALISAGTAAILAAATGVAQWARDRPMLQIRGERYWPANEPDMIRIDIHNAGRRPVEVHEAGVLLRQSGHTRRVEAGPGSLLPAKLQEGEAIRLYLMFDELGAAFAHGNGRVKRVYADIPGRKLKTGRYKGKRRETA